MHNLSKWMPILTRGLVVALGGLVTLGCDAVVCGDGTIEREGTCVPADDMVGAAQCGDGTVLGAGGKCEPEEVVVCDPDTTRAETDPVTDVITCVGTGSQTGCAAELPCPAPSGSNTSICGRLHDTQTGLAIQAMTPTGAACTATPATEGPCSLKVTFYDALDFATQPNPTPLIPGAFTLDDCGRYAAINIPPSNLGFTGIAVDDATGTPDRHKLTGVALPDGEAVPARGFEAFVTRNETDTAWTSSAGLTGESFATRGVIAMIFRYRDLPVAGVQVRRNSMPIPADDYYFSDTGAARNTVMASLTTTGANGSALVIGAGSPTAHDGAGSEPAGCAWPNSLAASIRGVVFVQVKDARNGGVICP